MSRGSKFLEYVSTCLKQRLAEVEDSIEKVQEDIDSMNRYYWDNYTEMDQYGYENYDNQQALFAQVGANQENVKFRHRLKRMLDSPFFGSVDFVYDGDEDAETFYIGIGNFAEKRGALPLIYDWRAPVSGLFYDFDKGEASYEAPAGLMRGEILRKSQYKIRRGRMVYEFESDMKIDDDILKEELGSNSDTKLKNIVRTIQKEQNAIIRNVKDKIMVIQGVAGSGKTSVALHRISYLLYHDREHLNSGNVLILSPNSVFSDYISHILPELGEENIQEMSFDLFAYRELQDVAGDCEDRYHHIERKIRGLSEEDQRRIDFKESKEYVDAVEGFLIELEDRLVDFKEVKYKGLTRSPSEIMDFFYDKFAGIPLLSRMDAVREYFIDEYETLTGRTISEEDLLEIQEKFDRLYVTKDLYEIYNWFLEDYDFPLLPDRQLKRRVLEYEDVYPVLYLKNRLYSKKAGRQVRHLVIDEMQDYSYLQYKILGSMFQCNMTILGDRGQTVDDRSRDVLEFLPEIFGKDMRKIEMTKSYRNTLEIAAYAEKFSSESDISYMERHGKEVDQIKVGSLEDGLAEIKQRISLGDDAYETAAILTLSEGLAEKVYERFKGQGENISYIDRDSSKFNSGLSITTFYMAKGLEFDQVFLLDENKESPLYQQFHYIGATRALHELYVVELEM